MGIKGYLYIGAVLFLVIGTWQVQEWRWESKKADALEAANKEHKEQQDKDHKLLLKTEIEKQEIRGIYNALQKRIRNVKSSGCTYSGEYIRLWNDTNRQAGASPTD